MKSARSLAKSSNTKTSLSVQRLDSPFKKYLRIALLELQKNLLQGDLNRLTGRIEEIKMLHENILSEQTQLLAGINTENLREKVPSGVSRLKRASGTTLPVKKRNLTKAIPGSSPAGNFSMEY